MQRSLFLLITVTILLISCSKQAVQSEPFREESSQPELVEQHEEQNEIETTQPIPEEPAIPVQGKQVEKPTKELVTAAESFEISEDTLKQIEGRIEELLEVLDSEDSIDVMYMVRPNDWLSKIAIKEYADMSMWKSIYRWNRKIIGPDPDLIYPFHEFTLKKPEDQVNPVEYDYYSYEVKPNESLWEIADSEYNNKFAWIVILRDNYETIGSDTDNITPGTNLKLRTRLF